MSIRTIAFWFTTIVIVFELIAGSAWNLLTIDWVEAQLAHLGYPDYFAYLLGVGHFLAAVAIIVPGFRLIKEWAYAGIFLLWSGAVVSHLALGDGLVSWGPPLMFLAFAVASWALRPADRRLRDRPADIGTVGADRPEPGPRAWAVSIGLVVALSAVSLLTLPAAEDFTREWAVDRGWVQEQRPSLTAARSEVLELKVENTQYQALDLGRTGISLGDMDVYSGNAIRDGRKAGRGGGSCQTIHVEGDKVTMQCVITMELDRGSVTMQSIWTRGTSPLDMAISGGTGDYRTARGTVRFWDIGTPNERVRAEIITGH